MERCLACEAVVNRERLWNSPLRDLRSINFDTGLTLVCHEAPFGHGLVRRVLAPLSQRYRAQIRWELGPQLRPAHHGLASEARSK